MSMQDNRLDLIAEDIEFIEANNRLTAHQREVIHDFELLMIAAEMQHNTKLFSIYRYRLSRYLVSEGLKCRPLITK